MPADPVPHGSAAVHPDPGSTNEEPMELTCAKLSPEERHCQLKAGECLHCGTSGHLVATYPVRPKESAC
ncbi:hypothetical protein ABVT39_000632 [Epinephelus coioides]